MSNWIKKLSKTYLQLNEQSGNYNPDFLSATEKEQLNASREQKRNAAIDARAEQLKQQQQDADATLKRLGAEAKARIDARDKPFLNWAKKVGYGTNRFVVPNILGYVASQGASELVPKEWDENFTLPLTFQDGEPQVVKLSPKDVAGGAAWSGVDQAYGKLFGKTPFDFKSFGVNALAAPIFAQYGAEKGAQALGKMGLLYDMPEDTPAYANPNVYMLAPGALTTAIGGTRSTNQILQNPRLYSSAFMDNLGNPFSKKPNLPPSLMPPKPPSIPTRLGQGTSVLQGAYDIYRTANRGAEFSGWGNELADIGKTAVNNLIAPTLTTLISSGLAPSSNVLSTGAGMGAVSSVALPVATTVAAFQTGRALGSAAEQSIEDYEKAITDARINKERVNQWKTVNPEESRKHAVQAQKSEIDVKNLQPGFFTQMYDKTFGAVGRKLASAIEGQDIPTNTFYSGSGITPRTFDLEPDPEVQKYFRDQRIKPQTPTLTDR